MYANSSVESGDSKLKFDWNDSVYVRLIKISTGIEEIISVPIGIMSGESDGYVEVDNYYDKERYEFDSYYPDYFDISQEWTSTDEGSIEPSSYVKMFGNYVIDGSFSPSDKKLKQNI